MRRNTGFVSVGMFPRIPLRCIRATCYARDHRPARALIYGRTTNGQRFVANAPHDGATYNRLTSDNQIGETVTLHHNSSSGLNQVRFAD
jgi:Thiolase-like protein type 1 additional C-terminal domain